MCGGLCEQPGAHHGVHRGGVGAGEHPPQRGFRREPRTGSGVEPGQHLGGHVGDPAGDRGERTHPAQYRRRAQGQHHRDRVVPALPTTPIRYCGEPVAAAQCPRPQQKTAQAERSASSSEPELEPASAVAYDSAMAG